MVPRPDPTLPLRAPASRHVPPGWLGQPPAAVPGRRAFTWRELLAGLCGVLVMASCSSSPRTTKLDTWDLQSGYRFIPEHDQEGDDDLNTDELFVILAFSGGGTRAAAMSYGVLDELKRVKFRWDEAAGEPCSEDECPDIPERSLLDEVDVISSVSGGSFTSAYYALNGRDIFDPEGRFLKDFLYHPVQRDLLGETAYLPNNWGRFKSRIEVAASYYAKNIFGDNTYAALTPRTDRPFIIVNSTDVTKGNRFEFTQKQFDLLCADLSVFPVARAVAASSAFPGLLSSMTIDSYAADGCDYEGPGSDSVDDWVPLGLMDRDINPPRYRQARQIEAYMEADRKHLHMVDGGVIDNIGVEPISQALNSTNVPVRRTGGQSIDRGLSVLTLINRGWVKKVLVIIVNARTSSSNRWDDVRAGPGTLAILNRSIGIPMGVLTEERPDQLQEFSLWLDQVQEPKPYFAGFELAFNDIGDESEREFFNNLGTNFELSPFEVGCLIDRGGALLRDGSTFTGLDPTPFRTMVAQELKGRIEPAPPPRTAPCTEAVAAEEIGTRTHYIDVGLHYSFPIATQSVAQLEERIGLSVRIVRPNGFGALFNLEKQPVEITDAVGIGPVQELGEINLLTVAAGAGYTRHWGPTEWTIGVTGGYGFGAFDLESSALEELAADQGLFGVRGEVKSTWMAQPQTMLWYNATNRISVLGFARYLYMKPKVRVLDDGVVYDRRLNASGLRLGLGLGFRLF